MKRAARFAILAAVVCAGLMCLKRDCLAAVLNEGEHSFPQGLTVAVGEELRIEPGARLKMGENARIIVKGRIIAVGTAEKPVVFEPANGVWRGIRIEGKNEPPEAKTFWPWFKEGNAAKEEEYFSKIGGGNIFEHCLFKGVSIKEKKFFWENKWKAAIEAYNTALRVTLCRFEDIFYIGGVLAQRSYVMAVDNAFASGLLHKSVNCTDNCVIIITGNLISQERAKNQPCADGIWVNNSAGLIAANTLKNIGDDAIDSDASFLVIADNHINTSWDDGIDIDNGSLAIVLHNKIEHSRENGILLSDGVSAILSGNEVTGAGWGLTLRDGAKAAAAGFDIQKNRTGIKLFQDVPCALSGKGFEIVKARLAAMSDEEIREKTIPEITGARQLAEVMEASYDKRGGYRILNINSAEEARSRWKMLKEIFKLADGPGIERVVNKETKQHPFYARLKNGLFLTSSKVVNNGLAVEPLGDYCMHISDTDFADEDFAGKIAGLCAKEYSCPLIEELNAAGSAYARAKKIVERSRAAAQEPDGLIILEKGEHRFPEGLDVGFGKTLVIKPGATLVMGENSRIVVRGRIAAIGNKDAQVIFKGDKGYWRGILIEGQAHPPDLEKYKSAFQERVFEGAGFTRELEKGSLFIHCKFQNLAADKKKNVLNRKRAAVEAEQAGIILNNCQFSDVVYMGCLQARKGAVLSSYNLFDSRMAVKAMHFMDCVIIAHHNRLAPKRYEHEAWPDGIYTDNGVGLIAYNEFDGLSDDAIDFDGALAMIFNNRIRKVSDDGIDIDNKTEAYIAGNTIEGASEHGILISNGSTAVLVDNKIAKAGAGGLALRNGGSVWAKSLDISDCGTGILMFDQPPLALTKNDFSRVRRRAAKLSAADIDYWGFYSLSNATEALRLLDFLYGERGDYMALKEIYYNQDAMNIFKVINVLELEDIARKAADLPFSAEYKKSVFHLGVKNSCRIKAVGRGFYALRRLEDEPGAAAGAKFGLAQDNVLYADKVIAFTDDFLSRKLKERR